MVFHPAIVGSFVVGSSRVNVVNNIRLTGSRTLTRQIANYHVARNMISGERVPTFADRTVSGVLIEEHGDMPSFTAGIVMTQDALLLTQDGFASGDRVYDNGKRFEVKQIEEKIDSSGKGFLFRAVHLHRLILKENM